MAAVWTSPDTWVDPMCIECGGAGAPCCDPPDHPYPTDPVTLVYVEAVKAMAEQMDALYAAADRWRDHFQAVPPLRTVPLLPGRRPVSEPVHPDTVNAVKEILVAVKAEAGLKAAWITHAALDRAARPIARLLTRLVAAAVKAEMERAA